MNEDEVNKWLENDKKKEQDMKTQEKEMLKQAIKEEQIRMKLITENAKMNKKKSAFIDNTLNEIHKPVKETIQQINEAVREAVRKDKQLKAILWYAETFPYHRSVAVELYARYKALGEDSAEAEAMLEKELKLYKEQEF